MTVTQTPTPLTGVSTLVTGASRGFGRAIATALAGAGAHVVAVARDRAALDSLGESLGGSVTPVVADVADAAAAGHLIDRYRPSLLVLNAGANPLPRPVHLQTWETFSRTWDVDVKQVFHWTREALLRPLDPGSTVVAFSSGAALGGSPLSGGYAGAKATIRFITSYAGQESALADLGIRFVSVLPQLTPDTDLGAGAVAGYAARQGVDIPTYLKEFGAMLTAKKVGEAVLQLATSPEHVDGRNGAAYVLTAEGLRPVS